MNQETIHLYTDGACSKNPGPAGAGVLLRYKNHKKIISKYLGNATNNIAELTAIKIGLEAIKDPSKPVIVYSDSQYSIGVLSNTSWNPKKNLELISEIKEVMSKFPHLEFKWVRGHSTDECNNVVDQLAVQAYSNKKDIEFYENLK